jgi:hypothetical protein
MHLFALRNGASFDSQVTPSGVDGLIVFFSRDRKLEEGKIQQSERPVQNYPGKSAGAIESRREGRSNTDLRRGRRKC